jgi:hypothetical protein
MGNVQNCDSYIIVIYIVMYNSYSYSYIVTNL